MPKIKFKYLRIRPKSENKLYINSNYEMRNYKEKSTSFTDKLLSFDADYNFNYYLYNKFGVGANTYFNYNNSTLRNNVYYDNFWPYTNGYVSWENNGYQKNQDNRINLTFSPGISFGRIYDGKYSSKIIEIIDELRKEGFLKRELSKEEFQKLSQIILIRKAKYHYDNRIKQIEALNDIANYLVNMGIIDNNTSPAFLIQDIYSYQMIDEEEYRKFGFKFYGTFNNYFYKIENKINDNFESEFKEINYDSGFINEEKYKDLSKYKNKYLTNGHGFNLGAKFYKIQNWNFFYNVEFDYKYSIEDVENINDYYIHRKFSIPADSIYKYQSDHSEDNSNTINRYTFSNNLFYKFNSRSICKISNAFIYSNTNNVTIRGSKPRKDDRYLETIRYQIEPQFMYYITPKFKLTSGVTFYYTKNYNRYEYFEKIDGHWEKSSRYVDNSISKATTFNISLGYYL